jgi:hypothetical protein
MSLADRFLAVTQGMQLAIAAAVAPLNDKTLMASGTMNEQDPNNKAR